MLQAYGHLLPTRGGIKDTINTELGIQRAHPTGSKNTAHVGLAGPRSTIHKIYRLLR